LEIRHLDPVPQVPAVLRAYRGVATIDDYLDHVIEQVAPPGPPSVPLSFSALDIPYAVDYLDAVWKSRTGSHLFVNLTGRRGGADGSIVTGTPNTDMPTFRTRLDSLRVRYVSGLLVVLSAQKWRRYGVGRLGNARE
jgi:hypothetical protein